MTDLFILNGNLFFCRFKIIKILASNYCIEFPKAFTGTKWTEAQGT